MSQSPLSWPNAEALNPSSPNNPQTTPDPEWLIKTHYMHVNAIVTTKFHENTITLKKKI